MFEITANATLSILLACLRFGANDLQTAYWLWKEDPQRARARACAAFYVASGVWKTAIVPLFVSGSIAMAWAVFSARAMQPANPITAQVVSALNVGLGASTVLVLLVGVAVVTSLAARWRVWVHGELHRSRRADIWPPMLLTTNRRRENLARPITMTALFVGILIGPPCTFFLLGMLDLPDPVRVASALAVVFGYPLFGAVSFFVLRSKVFADSAWECWPESIQQVQLE